MTRSSSSASVELDLVFDPMSSPESLRREPLAHHQAQMAHNYNFSRAVYDETTDNASTTDEDHFVGRHLLLESVPSRHSSVSSFPASVIHHTPTYERTSTPSRSSFYNSRAETPTFLPRPHSTGFRHPSSVRALQMRDEFESTDCDDLTASHRGRNSKLSYSSYRSGSSHSSPTKSLRISRSAHTSPAKIKVKQEYPLVLLHCTLLPPSLAARAQSLSPEIGDKEAVLEAIIPEPYTKRWKTLQEKVVKNAEVCTRGVLIPHPREEYESLEERLLESLELERPRIRQGHYLASNQSDTATDSGFESAGADTDFEAQPEGRETEAETIHSEKCPDCGHQLSEGVEQERNWEVKVFAANGLMKAGAWGAAWSEMEKVDVEINVWMPEDVRREVDARLDALITKDLEDRPKKEKRRKGIDDERAREIYGASHEVKDRVVKRQEEIDGLTDRPATTKLSVQVPRQRASQPQEIPQPPLRSRSRNQLSKPQPELSTAVVRYVGLLARDPRNIAIALLSALLLFYGFAMDNKASKSAVTVKSNAHGTILQPLTTTETMFQTTTSVTTRVTTEMVPLATSETSVEAIETTASISTLIEHDGDDTAPNPLAGHLQENLVGDAVESEAEIDTETEESDSRETTLSADLTSTGIPSNILSPDPSAALDYDKATLSAVADEFTMPSDEDVDPQEEVLAQAVNDDESIRHENL